MADTEEGVGATLILTVARAAALLLVPSLATTLTVSALTPGLPLVLLYATRCQDLLIVGQGVRATQL